MELWTPEHVRTLLPAVVLMLALAIVLRLWLGKKTWAVRMLPFQILTYILLALEVGKQAMSLWQGYDLYCLPFHYCSLFLVMMPLMAFYKGPRWEKISAISTAICMATFVLFMVYPNLIYPAWSVNTFTTSYFSFHTVVFHNIVAFQMILIFALDLHTPGKQRAHKSIVLFMVIFCIVSAAMAYLLKTNFNNFYSCNIPVLETVRLAVADALGDWMAALVYVSIVSALNIGFTWGMYLLFCLIHKYTKIC